MSGEHGDDTTSLFPFGVDLTAATLAASLAGALPPGPGPIPLLPGVALHNALSFYPPALGAIPAVDAPFAPAGTDLAGGAAAASLPGITAAGAPVVRIWLDTLAEEAVPASLARPPGAAPELILGGPGTTVDAPLGPALEAAGAPLVHFQRPPAARRPAREFVFIPLHEALFGATPLGRLTLRAATFRVGASLAAVQSGAAPPTLDLLAAVLASEAAGGAGAPTLELRLLQQIAGVFLDLAMLVLDPPFAARLRGLPPAQRLRFGCDLAERFLSSPETGLRFRRSLTSGRLVGWSALDAAVDEQGIPPVDGAGPVGEAAQLAAPLLPPATADRLMMAFLRAASPETSHAALVRCLERADPPAAQIAAPRALMLRPVPSGRVEQELHFERTELLGPAGAGLFGEDREASPPPRHGAPLLGGAGDETPAPAGPAPRGELSGAPSALSTAVASMSSKLHEAFSSATAPVADCFELGIQAPPGFARSGAVPTLDFGVAGQGLELIRALLAAHARFGNFDSILSPEPRMRARQLALAAFYAGAIFGRHQDELLLSATRAAVSRALDAVTAAQLLLRGSGLQATPLPQPPPRQGEEPLPPRSVSQTDLRDARASLVHLLQAHQAAVETWSGLLRCQDRLHRGRDVMSLVADVESRRPESGEGHAPLFPREAIEGVAAPAFAVVSRATAAALDPHPALLPPLALGAAPAPPGTAAPVASPRATVDPFVELDLARLTDRRFQEGLSTRPFNFGPILKFSAAVAQSQLHADLWPPTRYGEMAGIWPSVDEMPRPVETARIDKAAATPAAAAQLQPPPPPAGGYFAPPPHAGPAAAPPGCQAWRPAGRPAVAAGHQAPRRRRAGAGVVLVGAPGGAASVAAVLLGPHAVRPPAGPAVCRPAGPVPRGGLPLPLGRGRRLRPPGLQHHPPAALRRPRWRLPRRRHVRRCHAAAAAAAAAAAVPRAVVLPLEGGDGRGAPPPPRPPRPVAPPAPPPRAGRRQLCRR